MKRSMSMILALTVVLLALALPASADRGGRIGHGGHGGRVGIGLYVGPGWWPYPAYPYYYPYYPYYYQQPPVIVQEPPEIYVQPAPTEQGEYWYFCPDPKGYYPDVKKCPKGWLKVVPPTNPPEGEE